MVYLIISLFYSGKIIIAYNSLLMISFLHLLELNPQAFIFFFYGKLQGECLWQQVYKQSNVWNAVQNHLSTKMLEITQL